MKYLNQENIQELTEKVLDLLAKTSVEIGVNEVTGFTINQSGSGYSKAKFEGCARAASGITEYTESGNAIFSNDTTAAAAAIDTEIKCLDALFVKRFFGILYRWRAKKITY